MDLVILAGGMGSRFGGAKQIEPIDENGDFIIDYSIFDAIKAGFDNVVIIVKPEFKEIFQKTIGERVSKKVNVSYAVQTLDLPQLEAYGIKREKPLGTAHAIFCAKDFVKDNFLVINADDFYGAESFSIAKNYLQSISKTSTDFALVGYKLKNTMTKFGAVKRGICQVQNGFVKQIDECTAEFQLNGIVAKRLDDGKQIKANGAEIVSMNMFCLTPKIFDFLEMEMKNFASQKQNLQSGEFLLPNVVSKMVDNGEATLKVLPTDETWIGMTYRQDKQNVEESLKKLVLNGKYPKNLWQN